MTEVPRSVGRTGGRRSSSRGRPRPARRRSRRPRRSGTAGGGCRRRARSRPRRRPRSTARRASAQPAVVGVQPCEAVTPSCTAPLLCSDQKSATGPLTASTTSASVTPSVATPAGCTSTTVTRLVSPAGSAGTGATAGSEVTCACSTSSGASSSGVLDVGADGELDRRAGRDAGDRGGVDADGVALGGLHPADGLVGARDRPRRPRGAPRPRPAPGGRRAVVPAGSSAAATAPGRTAERTAHDATAEATTSERSRRRPPEGVRNSRTEGIHSCIGGARARRHREAEIERNPRHSGRSLPRGPQGFRAGALRRGGRRPSADGRPR